MRENVIQQKGKIAGAITITTLLCILSCMSPLVYGSSINERLNQQPDSEFQEMNSKIVDMLNYVREESDEITKEKIYERINEFLDKEPNTLSKSSFEMIYHRLEHLLGKEQMNHYLTILDWIINDIKDNDNSLFQCIREYYQSKNEFIDLITTNSDTIDIENIELILDKVPLNQERSIQINDEFGEYWKRYRRAKCFWDGYMPKKGGEPSDRNVNKRIGLWRGENFYNWSEGAADYILGTEEETGTAPFFLMNIGGFILFAIAVGLGVPSFLLGLPDTVGLLTLGGGLSIFGLIVVGLMLAYDWTVLNYFLFGVNGYLECQRFGNVDFIVHIVDEQNNDITKPCTVIARNENAFDKEGQPVYPGFEEVNWSTKEFEYNMKKVENNDGNKFSTFSLHSSQKSPEKWEKAVPPPGTWSFTVNAEGYKPKEYVIDDEISPGECFNLTIKIHQLDT